MEAGEISGADNAAIEAARREAAAVVDVRTQQVTKLSEENVKLTQQLTAAQSKLSGLSDDDYAKTELFRAMKTKYTELVKRGDDFEAANSEMKEQLKQLQGERSSYREIAESELKSTTIDMQSQLAQTDVDLSRIRSMRDKLSSDLAIKESQVNEHKASVEQLKVQLQSRDTRIEALEVEAQRLRDSETGKTPLSLANDSNADLEAVQAQLRQAITDKTSLEKELESMGAAWKKASVAAGKKFVEIADAEERINKTLAEKAKADQKYFAAMKLKDTKEAELRAAKTQNSRSAEIVSQLKEGESTTRQLVVTLEKQLADVKDSLGTVTSQYRTAMQDSSEHKSLTERLNTQVNKLKTQLSTKDASVQTMRQAQQDAEAEASRAKSKLEDTQKHVEIWKKKSSANQSEDVIMLKVIEKSYMMKSF